MKCPKCGYAPIKGRPKKLDDAKVTKLKDKGMSLQEIADKLDVSKGAIQFALKRSKHGKSNQ